MSAITTLNGSGELGNVKWTALSDCRALIGRHLRHLIRMPEKLVSATLMPMGFVVLFGLLFGSVISVSGGSYQEFIMAGIFTQVMMTCVPNTAIGTVEDLRNGLVDRFRSLPMNSAAVLVGRTAGDLALRAVTVLAMTAVGFAIGWRIETGFFAALGAYAVLLLFGFTMSWIGAVLGLVARSGEAAATMPSLLLMPLMFLSSAYIPTGGLPGWLQAIANWNPLSAVVNALRSLWGNPAATDASVFTVQYAVPLALGWMALILLVTVPVAVRRYRRAVAR
ncbi:ABC transporter permease [Haloechinothrix halophila]|uniref:ABC transporter permease n=1 Tax=Haloechinothrix halophila TaxID=1069073 RepID=UPI00068565A2|nr:ABC transporter permease [Haloechinothrix halophila]